MRSLAALFVLLVSMGGTAAADCSPNCIGGGGPATNDCVVTWGGITSTQTTCVDGSACDQDGVADGVCTFPLEACFGIDAATCGVTAVTSVKVSPASLAGGAALGAGIQVLTPGQCTEPGFTVAVKATPAKLKAGKAKLRVLAVADGKKDADKITLICEPAAPSFAAVIQPILTARCANPTCHDNDSVAQGLNLSEGHAPASVVNVPSTEGGALRLVSPGSLKKSFLAKKVTPGAKLKFIEGLTMPQGCPGAPISDGGCPTPAEVYAILAWIQAGALAN
ncbi:MAG TPA: hypothetical protein VGR62_23360 [Candidatus Binatia bacterium]|jgi:hypothetical protein|nr:hypothetical protein [Candidatus Binatia bacterium]